MLNWRHVYFIALGLRVYFALGDSYIHPDEHFQSFSVLSPFASYLPWEFTAAAPARSLFPLYLTYSPLLYLSRYFSLPPHTTLYLFRLQFAVLSWVVTDWSVHRLLPTKPERVKALLFIATSYVTMTYQSHTFSNAMETLLLLPCLVLINTLRERLAVPDLTPGRARVFLLGGLIAMGVFTRITFLGFILFPSYFLLQSFRQHPVSLLWCLLGFGLVSALAITTDTYAFGSASFVVAPLNNLLYNTNLENLAAHGIHPRYTHLLANLPQLLGPGLVFLLYRNGYRQTTPFLALVSGLSVLSVVPHQELRFLVPLLPVACCCFDLRPYLARVTTLVMYAWYGFNALMAVFMGTLHQGGVTLALSHLEQESFAGVQVWWRTYSPPEWLMGDRAIHVVRSENLSTLASFEPSASIIVDLMGADLETVHRALELVRRFPTKRFVAPLGSHGLITIPMEPVWSCRSHLGMDHFDLTNLRSFTPGLAMYALL